MCEGELLEADGELDVAGPNYVLDLELSKLGLPPATPRSGAALRVPRDFFIRAGNWHHAPQKRPSRWLQVPPGLPSYKWRRQQGILYRVQSRGYLFSTDLKANLLNNTCIFASSKTSKFLLVH